MTTPSINVSVILPLPIYQAVNEAAGAVKISRSKWVRRAIESALASPQPECAPAPNGDQDA